MDILVVDDSSAMRMMVVRALRQAGFDANIKQACDGAEGFDMVCKKEPDLILSDWNMPNMNGIQFLEKLREENISTTFGFITTESTSEMRKRAADAGAKFLIAKPFTVDAFEQVRKTFFS